MSASFVFLKLGGSLITDKLKKQTTRLDVIARLAEEIAAARAVKPDLRILLGHGSGSFGHAAARQYGTRQGVRDQHDWHGFIQVWRAARALNQIVMDALASAGLPAIAFPPSATMIAQDGIAQPGNIDPLISALENGILPVVQGDVAFDTLRGGTILSTEDVFCALAPLLQPQRILIAGVEEGVWADFPENTRLVDEIIPESYQTIISGLGGSAGVDVTGGMREKVELMLKLVQQCPGLEAAIFSASRPGSLLQSLIDEPGGTRIRLQ
jgi:isopentenyl phosphate kinase